MKKALLIIVVPFIFVGAAYLEYSIWSECRSTNSFWYWLRVLHK